MSAHLRSWSTTDAEALGDLYSRADADLLSNIPDDRTAGGALAWIEEILTAEADGRARAYAIIADGAAAADGAGAAADGAAADGAIVGNVMAAHIERRHSSAWISYWLTASARGQGLASAALRTLADELHDELGIHRLELGYRVNNPASGAVAKSAGFLVEGREREKLLYDGIRYDTEVAARLSTDPRSPGRRLPLESPPA